jgi:5-(carboxyamino)imidazole ribonucleotide synthase
MKIGILGGGQLSRMLALAGIPLGFEFSFYFPKCEHALNKLGKIYHGKYGDYPNLQAFADQVDVITYENENIPATTLEFLAQNKPVYPDRKALLVAQDRLAEKSFFCQLQIPTNGFMAVNSKDDLLAAIKNFGYPLIIKKRTQGYDGKGQLKIDQDTNVDLIANEYCHHCIAEEFVAFNREVSLIAARNNRGESVCYDICENIHNKGILFKTFNRTNDAIFALARSYVNKIIQQLDYVGILAVEFFQVENKLIANEMAPRVHNSGHWTLDACVTSQFENHLRCIADLPLGDVTSLTPAVMYNILNHMPDKNKLLEFAGLKLHDYCKAPAKGRKLGHATLLKPQLADAMVSLEKILLTDCAKALASSPK